ncbi:MAG TPA: glycosyltransferase [Candidatus Cloacimonadota bacterium]|nr:glycosyltransferase [Candidatus Cloacimonadota bacterium]
MLRDVLFVILCCLTGSGFVTYIVFCIRFWFGYKNYTPVKNYRKRSVSVIVVTRNEGRNLPTLLTALVNQDYPLDLYEIIIADDASEDDTAELVARHMDLGVKLLYLSIPGRDKVLSPKKNALKQAIAASSGEVILTTDADCIVPLTWITSMIEAFADGVSMVAGYSRTKLESWDKASLVQKYEHFDFAGTYMVLGGGYTIGRSWACIGQNLAYTRTAFESVGGFSKIEHLISGDDVNLMQLMRRAGHRIIFNFDKRSFVHTLPVKSWKQLTNQRSRWASNMKYQLKFDPEFFFILLSMAFMYWGGILMLAFNWKLALLIYAFRILVENIFLGYARSHFEVSARMMRFYPIWLLIQNFFLVFTMVLGQFNLFVWHGKKPYKRSKA